MTCASLPKVSLNDFINITKLDNNKLLLFEYSYKINFNISRHILFQYGYEIVMKPISKLFNGLKKVSGYDQKIPQ